MKTPRIVLLLLFVPLQAIFATSWQVGPGKTYTYCSQVAPLVQHGDTVLIDYATYTNDAQVLWNKNNLYLLGTGGRPRLVAGSIIAGDLVNGKGIFVISGSNVRVENIEFSNAQVVDHNGAGIRQEGANLLVTHCKFDGNEMGILCGNIANCKTIVEYSEFVNGGSAANPGYQHNIYINHIDSFIFRYNYTHEAIAEGHELKSRANHNFILYNRIANEQSVDSRSIDLPNGGTAVIVGNIIEQGNNSANSNLFGYGLEGLTNPAPHNVWISSNTFINKKPTGSFIQIAAGTDTLYLKNNILAGAKTGGLLIGSAFSMDSSNNLIHDDLNVFGFNNISNYNYHLMSNSVAIDAGVVSPLSIKGYSLKPVSMYKDTCQVESRGITGLPDIGAFEYMFPLGTYAYHESKVLVFPNPTKGPVLIRCDGEEIKQVNIFAQNGRLLRSFRTCEFMVDDLLPGLYLITISTDKNYFSRQLTIFY